MMAGHPFPFSRPRPWPPIQRATEWRSYFEHLRRCDPWGGGVQAMLAGVAIVGVATGTAPASIAICALLGFSILRVHRSWRGMSALLGVAWFPPLAAWLLWSALSLTWSADSWEGISQHKGYSTLLLIPLGLPLIAHRGWLLCLLGALCVAHALMTDMAGALGALGNARCAEFAYNGVFWHPTISGLWPAMAIAVGVVLWTMRWRVSGAAVAVAGAAALSLHDSRSATLAGLAAGLVVAFRAAGRWGRTVLIVGGVAAAGAVLAVSMRFGDVPRLSEAITWSQRPTPAATDPLEIPDVRLPIYRAAIRGWQEAPLCGRGLGSWPIVHAEQRSRDPQLFAQYEHEQTVRSAHPHSTWLEVLVESGTIGAALLLLWVALAFRALWLRAATDSLSLFCLGVAVVWLVTSGLNNAHSPIRWLAPLVFALLLGALPATAQSAARANR